MGREWEESGGECGDIEHIVEKEWGGSEKRGGRVFKGLPPHKASKFGGKRTEAKIS